MVTKLDEQETWRLTDLLGRAMGVVAARDGRFVVEPEGNAVGTMNGMSFGPYASLDDALAAIETHTRGVCRRGADGGA